MHNPRIKRIFICSVLMIAMMSTSVFSFKVFSEQKQEYIPVAEQKSILSKPYESIKIYESWDECKKVGGKIAYRQIDTISNRTFTGDLYFYSAKRIENTSKFLVTYKGILVSD